MTEFAPAAEIRSEIKWKMAPSQMAPIVSLLREHGFSHLHAARRIFSVYYDDARLTFFRLGEEGIVPRQKFRVRWYHNREGFRDGARIEIKETGVTGRRKYSMRFQDPDAASQPLAVRRIFRRFENRVLRPVSLVTYVRRYFADDRGYRATIDTQIQYARVTAFDGRRLVSSPLVADPDGVLELKTPMHHEPLEFAENLPLTRDSSRASRGERGRRIRAAPGHGGSSRSRQRGRWNGGTSDRAGVLNPCRRWSAGRVDP